MNTVLLDRTTWDFLMNANGSLAVASDAYAIAQDVASAVRVFEGEVYYDTSQGLPYRQKILGRGQSLALFNTDAEAAAMTTPGVVSARAVTAVLRNTRQITGSILISDTEGNANLVGIG